MSGSFTPENAQGWQLRQTISCAPEITQRFNHSAGKEVLVRPFRLPGRRYTTTPKAMVEVHRARVPWKSLVRDKEGSLRHQLDTGLLLLLVTLQDIDRSKTLTPLDAGKLHPTDNYRGSTADASCRQSIIPKEKWSWSLAGENVKNQRKAEILKHYLLYVGAASTCSVSNYAPE
ncbi:hypothetical protein BaRGS_00029789 [Batillaria attramentaria]|uniref:Uncharacterized protein n=1 Tax=Batillaria attramentaria TaxID=370345 RepID=A0ABD0JW97_9CAEN